MWKRILWRMVRASVTESLKTEAAEWWSSIQDKPKWEKAIPILMVVGEDLRMKYPRKWWIEVLPF